MVARAFASEFPNDNPALHMGTIWMCIEPCGAPEPHFPEAVDDGSDGSDEPIEIVDSIELEGPIEVVPLPLESGIVPAIVDVEESQTILELSEETTLEAFEESLRTTEPPPVRETAALIESTPPPPPPPPPPLAEVDAYASFLSTLTVVASASGYALDASAIEASLEGDAVARAWRAILRGESEDFSLCATTFDDWASSTLARILSAPHAVAQLRRELRSRGVAAFGLVEAA